MHIYYFQIESFTANYRALAITEQQVPMNFIQMLSRMLISDYNSKVVGCTAMSQNLKANQTTFHKKYCHCGFANLYICCVCYKNETVYGSAMITPNTSMHGASGVNKFVESSVDVHPVTFSSPCNAEITNL